MSEVLLLPQEIGVSKLVVQERGIKICEVVTWQRTNLEAVCTVKWSTAFQSCFMKRR